MNELLEFAQESLHAQRALVVYGPSWASWGFKEGEDLELLQAVYPPPEMPVPEHVMGDPQYTQTYDPDWSWMAGIAREAWATRAPVCWKRSHHLPGQYIGSVMTGPNRTMVIFPLRQGERQVGFLFMDRSVNRGLYTEEDLPLFEEALRESEARLEAAQPGLPELRLENLIRYR